MSGITWSWEAARFFVDVLYILGLVGVALYAFITNRSKVNAEAIIGMDARLDDHEGRIITIEERDRHAPNRGDIEALHARISGVKDNVIAVGNTVAGLAEAVKGMARSVNRLNDFHMKGGDK